ncbi:MAG: SH3 domain-containing protein [Clostridia bacterium]|nr:SH3 domain-containing protein [Clostridia bacterium]MBR6965726.1 SH3 domain-containing protein [Clostridia bacterium]
MNRKIIAMIIAVITAIMMIVPAALAEDNTPPDSEGYYYVYTENGKGLNVRESPGGRTVGSLKYGSRIYCYYRDGGNGWALINFKYDNGYGYGTYAAFVSSRYLRKTKPEPRTGGSSSKSSSSSAAADTISEINAEFRSARKVTPFTVTVRPSRTSGWVNMRWAPSKSAEVVATYKQNEKLLVIKETNNWYQVEDQDTGDVGFISKQFVAQ